MKVTLTVKAIQHYTETENKTELDLSWFFVFDEFVQNENEIFVKKFRTLGPENEEFVKLKECIISDSQKQELEKVEEFKIPVPLPEVSEGEEAQKNDGLEYFESRPQLSPNGSIDLGMSSQLTSESTITPPAESVRMKMKSQEEITSAQQILNSQIEEMLEDLVSTEDEEEEKEEIPSEEDLISADDEKSVATSEEIRPEPKEMKDKIEYIDEISQTNNSEFSTIDETMESEEQQESFQEAFTFKPIFKVSTHEKEVTEDEEEEEEEDDDEEEDQMDVEETEQVEIFQEIPEVESEESYKTPTKERKNPYENLLKHSYTPKKTQEKRLSSKSFRIFVEKIQGSKIKKNEKLILKEEKEYLEYISNKISSPALTPTSSIPIRKSIIEKKRSRSEEPKSRKRKYTSQNEQEDLKSKKHFKSPKMTTDTNLNERISKSSSTTPKSNIKTWLNFCKKK